MVCAFYRGGYRYCFNATPHHCAHHQRCGQSPPQGHPNTTLLGFRVALRRRAGLKTKYDAEDAMRRAPPTWVLRLGVAVRKAAKMRSASKRNFSLGFASGGRCVPGQQTGRQAWTRDAKRLAKIMLKRLGQKVGQDASPRGWPSGLAKRLSQEAWPRGWPKCLAKRLAKRLGQKAGREAWPRGWPRLAKRLGQEAWPRGQEAGQEAAKRQTTERQRSRSRAHKWGLGL